MSLCDSTLDHTQQSAGCEPGKGLHGLPGFPATAAVASDDCQSVVLGDAQQLSSKLSQVEAFKADQAPLQLLMRHQMTIRVYVSQLISS